MIRIHHILCPVDFFPASEIAANYAIALAKKTRARLSFIHVVEPVARSAYDFAFDMPELVKAMTAQAMEELNKLAKRAQGSKVRADLIVRTGEVDLQIQSLIKKRNVDFVVMGTHGRRGIEKFFMGSTTERLLRKLNVPLLTIGNIKSTTVPNEFRHILVTTDFSEGTTDAIGHAFSIAREYDSKVTLVHVLNDVQADISGRYRDQLVRSIQRELEDLIPDKARNSRDVTVRVDTGLPIRRILSILSKEKIDLIVMNVHGKTLFDRLSIGSTAEKLVRGANIPVLVIPPIAAAKHKRRRPKKVA